MAGHYITLHYITFHYITLHYIKSHHLAERREPVGVVAGRYITLHFITLHFTPRSGQRASHGISNVRVIMPSSRRTSAGSSASCDQLASVSASVAFGGFAWNRPCDIMRYHVMSCYTWQSVARCTDVG